MSLSVGEKERETKELPLSVTSLSISLSLTHIKMCFNPGYAIFTVNFTNEGEKLKTVFWRADKNGEIKMHHTIQQWLEWEREEERERQNIIHPKHSCLHLLNHTFKYIYFSLILTFSSQRLYDLTSLSLSFEEEKATWNNSSLSYLFCKTKIQYFIHIIIIIN